MKTVRTLPVTKLISSVALLLSIGGCNLLNMKGGGSGGSGGSVTITNKITSIASGGVSVQLVVTAPNDVTWTLTAGGAPCSPACGSLGPGSLIVVYTSPATTPAAPNNSPTITVTSVKDSTKSDTDSFTITSPISVTVTITNKVTTANAGGSAITFSATVQNDPTSSGVSWTLTAGSPAVPCAPTCGSLSGTTTTSVTYTPPATAPAAPNNTPTITATSVHDSTKSDSDTLTIMSSGGTAVTVGTSVPFPIFAGDPVTAIPITVTNDAAGDMLTATLTVDANTGLPCPSPTCGTLGSVTGTSGSGSYSVLYTPPPAAGFTTQIVPTLVVSSSLPGSFADTDFIEVDPAGVPLVFIGGGGINGIIQVGTAAKTVTATVYNDTNLTGVTFTPLTASGYACDPSTNSRIGTNSCGTLGASSAPVVSGTTTTTTITYTPPASLPSAPYDRPRLPAVSKANNTQLASGAFLLSSNPPPVNTGLRILGKFNSGLAAPGAAPITVFAFIGNDTGNSRTVTWTLMAGGVSCSPTCGTLGSQVDTGNGASVSSQINYTPPSSGPTVTADLMPTITATSVDATSETDSFTFTIVDGTCGTGHESVLNGQYAFLARGGGMVDGYTAIIGSFTANGAGGITTGLLDFNTGLGPGTGTILSAGSSYTVGADNRVCLVFADSTGGVENFRAGVGTLVGGVATEGRIIRFNDNNGRRVRQSGVLMKQDTTSFANSQLNGNYAFGEEGVDSSGGRFAGAGVVTSDGAGHFTSIIGDFDDAGTVSGAVAGGTGSYSVTANGRGTASSTLTILGRTSTGNLVFYMVSSTEALFMTTDSLPAGKPIFSGELKKQAGPFTANSFDNSDYVIHAEGLGTNGGNDTFIAQATFTTNGNATLTSDENNNGTEGTEQISAITLTIASNGRTTVSGGGGGHQPVIYLIDSNSAFLVDTSNSVSFGFIEKQTGGPFSNASLSGPVFFGGDAPNTGTSFSSGTATFDGVGGITGTSDSSGANGLKKDTFSPTSNGGTYSFSITSTPQGKGFVGMNSNGTPMSIAYVISGSKLIFMNTGSNPAIFIVQK